jgi:hypothetical protein
MQKKGIFLCKSKALCNSMRQRLTLGRWTEFAPHIAVGQAVGSSGLHVAREKPRRVFSHGFIEDDKKEAHTRVRAAQFNQGRRLTRACHWRRVFLTQFVSQSETVPYFKTLKEPRT